MPEDTYFGWLLLESELSFRGTGEITHMCDVSYVSEREKGMSCVVLPCQKTLIFKDLVTY